MHIQSALHTFMYISVVLIEHACPSHYCIKVINRIPGSRLLISRLPGNALRTLVDILRLVERFKRVLKADPGKNLISKYAIQAGSQG